MIHTLSRSARAIGVVAAALGLTTAGLVVATSGPASATARSTTITLDHFLCYGSTGTGFKVPKGVQLTNKLQPHLFTPTILSVATHCNPANKEVVDAAGGKPKYYGAKNPKAHLLCWKIAYPNFPQTVVDLTNQFGQAAMEASPPTGLCVPTWKKLTGPPRQKAIEPPGLDHFTCYPLAVVKGAYGFVPPPVVKVEDEFSYPKYVQIRVGVANLLCVPTIKVVGGVVYKTQGAKDKSLVCFVEALTPIRKLVYDQNQFGTGKVFPTQKNEELCLPSTLALAAAG